MITDFVRDNHAYLRCLECGAEGTILKYVITEKYDFPVIDEAKTIEGIEAFKVKHALCKKVPIEQFDLFKKP